MDPFHYKLMAFLETNERTESIGPNFPWEKGNERMNYKTAPNPFVACLRLRTHSIFYIRWLNHLKVEEALQKCLNARDINYFPTTQREEVNYWKWMNYNENFSENSNSSSTYLSWTTYNRFTVWRMTLQMMVASVDVDKASFLSPFIVRIRRFGSIVEKRSRLTTETLLTSWFEKSRRHSIYILFRIEDRLL